VISHYKYISILFIDYTGTLNSLLYFKTASQNLIYCEIKNKVNCKRNYIFM